MTIAIMQPYVFPYVGYFQMIDAVDLFVLLDDVSFIKKGWINRNKILLSSRPFIFTLPCEGISQNRRINEIYSTGDSKELEKILKSIRHAYVKAPYFKDIYPLVEMVLNRPNNLISEVAGDSIKCVCEYLGLEKRIVKSSQQFAQTQELKGAHRLARIAKESEASGIINAPGGKSLYTKDFFREMGLDLFFLNPILERYDQIGNKGFVGGLSIIDPLMHLSPEQVKDLLKNYSLN